MGKQSSTALCTETDPRYSCFK